MYLSATASWQCAVGRASGRDGLARFGATDAATHPAPDRTRGVRCVRAGTVTVLLVVPAIMIMTLKPL